MREVGVKNLYLFSPAYKVGGTIGKNLEMFEDLEVMLKARGCSLHLLIINDNSPDNTKEVLESFAGTHSFMEVQNNEKNLGNAGNIILGYNWMVDRADDETALIGCLDADGEHNPLANRKHIDYILEEGYDGVVGSIIYPDHRINWLDMNMMRFNGGLQAAMMGISEPFYIQSPGYQLHRPRYPREAVKNLLPRYEKFYSEMHHGEEMPRWGMHAVVDSLITLAGAKLKSVYLECFMTPPNRNPKKLMDQAWASMIHAKTLHAFC